MPDKPRVLVVDDDRPHVQAMSIRLRAAGYDVRTAFDGRAGLAEATAAPFHAIVLDIQMPDIDGLTFLAELALDGSSAKTPVVMVSACADRRQESLDAGAKYFLEKPYDNRRLVAILESLVDHSAPVA